MTHRLLSVEKCIGSYKPSKKRLFVGPFFTPHFQEISTSFLSIPLKLIQWKGISMKKLSNSDR